MGVVHRAHGFRFVICTSDHEPAHVLITGGGHAKINLLGAAGIPEVVFSGVSIGGTCGACSTKCGCIVKISCASGSVSMGVASDIELKRAEAMGKRMLVTEPRAAAARYDRKTGRIVVELTNGCSCAFPAALVQDLQNASADELSDVRVDGYRFNLNFPALDVDLYVPALVSGIFGTRAWMTRELARIAGRRTSLAKASAARANGAKGGRPRKVVRG